MRTILLSLTLFISFFSFAQKKQQSDNFIRRLSKPAKAVNDFGHFLKASEIQLLEKELVRYYKTSTNAIAVITLDSLTDPKTKKQYTIEETALLYFNKWGLGDSIKNNGVLILITRKPRGVRIEVGTGLETVLTNEVCKQVIDEQLVPSFKKQLFFTGLKDAIDALEKALDDEQQAAATGIGGDNVEAVSSTESVSYTEEFQGSTTGNNSPATRMLIVFFVFMGIVVITIIINGQSTAAGFFTASGYQHFRDESFNSTFLSSSSIDSSSSSPSFDSGSDSGGYSGGSSDGGGASGSW
jgi:uncharacterized protein